MNEWQRLVNKWKNFIADGPGARNGKGQRRPDIKMCPVCGKFVSARAPVCEYCEAELAPKPQRTVDQRGKALAEPINPSIVTFAICIFFMGITIFLSSRMEDYSLAGNFWSPHPEALVRAGANFNTRTFAEGEIWRICTYMFLHGGMMHIFFNLMALAQLGAITFMNFGARRFWLITFVTGMAGGLLSAASIIVGNVSLSTGFSGALFGFLGVNYVHFQKHGPFGLAERFKKFMIWGNVICIGVTLVGLLPIDNFAHIGGMLAGLGLGHLFYSPLASRLSPAAEKVMLAAILIFWGYGLYRSFVFVQAFYF